MGNKESIPQFEHGHMAITFDKPYYTAGGELTGQVNLQLTQQYPAATLNIELKGIEECDWRNGKDDHPHQDPDNKFILHHIGYHKDNYGYEGDAEAINIHVYLCCFEDQYILPGQYTFPFRAKIPQNCPSSCFFSGDLFSKGLIFYTATAILVADSLSKIKPTMVTKPFLICQQPYEIFYDQLSSSTLDIKGFMVFFSKGKATLTTTVEKSVYASNETIKINIKLDNTQCKAEVKSINVCLRQHSWLKNKIGATYHIRRSVWNNDYAGSDIFEKDNTLDVRIPLFLISPYGVQKPCKAEDQEKYFTVLQPTAMGKRVNILYSLRVKVEYNNTAAHVLKTMTHIFITPPLDKEEFYPKSIQAPEGWSPTIYNESILSESNATEHEYNMDDGGDANQVFV